MVATETIQPQTPQEQGLVRRLDVGMDLSLRNWSGGSNDTNLYEPASFEERTSKPAPTGLVYI